MAAKRKQQSTLTQVERAVTSAAKSPMTGAEEYVVDPVSKALGLSSGKSTKKRKSASTKKRKGATPSRRAGSGSAARGKSSKRATKRPAKRPTTRSASSRGRKTAKRSR